MLPKAGADDDHDDHDDHDDAAAAAAAPPPPAIRGDELVFGNDFDVPIRDRLPPGFGKAFKLVRWVIDPGLEGDPYADKPYLYGPALSSVNLFRVGERAASLREYRARGSGGGGGTTAAGAGDNSGSSGGGGGAVGAGGTAADETDKKKDNNGNGADVVDGDGYDDDDGVVLEGGDGDGQRIRDDKGVPREAAARRKWFLDEARRKEWLFEPGRVYHADFFNPYIDFNGARFLK